MSVKLIDICLLTQRLYDESPRCMSNTIDANNALVASRIRSFVNVRVEQIATFSWYIFAANC